MRFLRLEGLVQAPGPQSLYEAFEAREAHRLARRFEWHYTPEHGSWLNVAECELSVLERQCLDRRIADKETLAQEVAAWERSRNAGARGVRWQFTTADARIHLRVSRESVAAWVGNGYGT